MKTVNKYKTLALANKDFSEAEYEKALRNSDLPITIEGDIETELRGVLGAVIEKPSSSDHYSVIVPGKVPGFAPADFAGIDVILGETDVAANRPNKRLYAEGGSPVAEIKRSGKEVC